LAANWRLLAGRAAPAECSAVVKADAYGTGIEQAVPALARAACRTFFTAHVSEGSRARASLRAAGFADADTRIFVLNGFHPEGTGVAAYRDDALAPVIGTPEELAAWSTARRAAALPPCALHVDTGMNRLGFDPEVAASLDGAVLDHAGVGLVMSHFACSEEPDRSINAIQVERFDTVRRGPLGRYPASLANSSGIFLDSHPVYDLVRPGYALYGGNPTPGRLNPMRAVVGLRATILQTRWIEAGETAGYGAAWTAVRPTCLATIGVGYADGLPRNAKTLGGDAGPRAIAGGVLCPLVGRVSMDLSIVDVTDAPDEARRPGAILELLGPTITVDDLGRQTGTIGYEILTSLGRRYKRLYLDGR
jgi:alanine racemase